MTVKLPDRSDLSPALEVARQTLSELHAEPRIGQSVKSHYQNLIRLAENLKRLGMEDSIIEQSVLDVFGEYERELTRYITGCGASATNRSERQ